MLVSNAGVIHSGIKQSFQTHTYRSVSLQLNRFHDWIESMQSRARLSAMRFDKSADYSKNVWNAVAA